MPRSPLRDRQRAVGAESTEARSAAALSKRDLVGWKLNFYFPAAMIYFDALASALARSDVTDQALAGIAEAHHMHIVGPASEQYV